MKKVILIIFIGLSCCCLGQIGDDLIAQYDEAFFDKDFKKAFIAIEKLLTKAPNNLSFRREYLKMLAATEQKEKFTNGMLELRQKNKKNELNAFFTILKSDVVPRAYVDELKNYFGKKQDFFMLGKWDPDNFRNTIKVTRPKKKEQKIKKIILKDKKKNDFQPNSDQGQPSSTENRPPPGGSPPPPAVGRPRPIND